MAFSMERLRADAQAIFEAGLAAVAPAAAVRRFLARDGDHLHVAGRVYDLDAYDRIEAIGAGKAAAAMAAAVETVLGDRLDGGTVVVKYGHSEPLERIRVLEAGHPVPDAASVQGARTMLSRAAAADHRTLLLVLISGGGSSLLCLPAAGLTLSDKQAATGILLGCGATIHEINTLRKHLSAVKGGRLGRAAHPADVITLILSDVVGDDLDIIASGPTVADGSTFADAWAVVERHGIAEHLSPAVRTHLADGASGRLADTPKPGDTALATVQNVIVGSNFEALTAARQAAAGLGYNPLVLSSLMEGETRHVAGVHAAIAREILRSGHPLPPPACILSGGETTVTLDRAGRGGRNQEFSLAAALDIAGCPGTVVLSAGTDGTDGPTDAAGAVADGDTLARAAAAGLDPRRHLDHHDAYPFFERLGDLIVTGPTRTNVMDLRIVLVAVPA